MNPDELVIDEFVFAIDLYVIVPWLGKSALFNFVPAINRAGAVFEIQGTIPRSPDGISR
jgi:hypothetical protein